jgi:hypothetical protein
MGGKCMQRGINPPQGNTKHCFGGFRLRFVILPYFKEGFMNKRIVTIGIVLILILTTVAIAFADAGVEYKDHSITVWNTGRGKLTTVELCVIYMDAANVRRETSMSFSNVTSTRQTKPFNLGKVIGAYSTFCPAPIED